MVRQSIFITETNNNWLKQKVAEEEYSSTSELLNDLISQARQKHAEIDLIRLKLKNAEKGGFTNNTKEEILKLSKSLING